GSGGGERANDIRLGRGRRVAGIVRPGHGAEHEVHNRRFGQVRDRHCGDSLAAASIAAIMVARSRARSMSTPRSCARVLSSRLVSRRSLSLSESGWRVLSVGSRTGSGTAPLLYSTAILA